MQFGNLQLHAAWAAERRESGNVVAQRYGTNWLLCPKVSADLLKLCDGGTGATLAKPIARRKLLLADALTSVSGEDWSRQRPAVTAAAGGGPSLQLNRHGEAVRQATQLATELASQLQVHDVLELAQRVAARAIVGAVMGSDEHASIRSASRSHREQLEGLLISFIRASRVPYALRDLPLCDRLELALKQAVEQQAENFIQLAEAAATVTSASAGISDQTPAPNPDASAPACTAEAVTAGSGASGAAAAAAPGLMAGAGAALSGASALLPRLLAQPALRRSEAVCNANSCLLAGFETTYLLIACSLLHLAQAPHIQAQARAALMNTAAAAGAEAAATATNGTSRATDTAARAAAAGAAAASRAAVPPLIGAILRETLRVNPPVSGLPRTVVAQEGIRLSLGAGPAQAAGGGSGGGAGGGARVNGGAGGEKASGGGEDCGGCAPARELDLPPGFAFSVDLLAAAHGWRHAGTRGASAAAAAAAAGACPGAPPAPTGAGGRSSTSSPPSSPRRASVSGFGVGACCPFLLSPAPTNIAAGRRSPAHRQRTQLRANTAGSSSGSSSSATADHNCREGGDAALRQGWDPTSWVWDPLRPAPPAGCPDPHSGAAPFGIGPRSCPAGSLSVVVAREVLVGLLARFAWGLARPDADRHWNSRTATVPTLAIRGPIPLLFEAVAAAAVP